MTRLVLHAGAEFADGGTVQRDLAAWREPLAAHGVMIPPGDDPAEWRETAQALLGRKAGSATVDLLSQAQQADVGTVLLSSDALADALTSPDEVAALAATAAEGGFEVRVVVVVREQVGYLNALYCRRVLTLETARSFAEFATTSVPAHRFDYVASFGAIADTAGVELVAIPYPDLLTQGAGRAVLKAAGLHEAVLADLPVVGDAEVPVPGPVVVGAARLLHKRMRRLGMFNEHGKPRLRLALNDLIARATEAGWDDGEFWGWDPTLRRRAEEESALSNAMFAEFVWGSEWPEAFSAGRTNRVDLAELEPAVLADIFTTVDRLLTGLTTMHATSHVDYGEHEDVALPDDEDDA